MSSRIEVPPGLADDVIQTALLIGLARKSGKRLTLDFVPTTDDELWDYVRTQYGIEIPRYAVCDDHDAPFTAFANAYFAREPMAMWLGSRGLSGKTFMAALLSYVEGTTLGASVNLLGGSLEQATIAHGYTRDWWAHPNAPRHLLLGDPTARETRLLNGGHERVLTASSKSVRGWHPQRLRIDEADEVKLEILDAALGQPMGREADPSSGRPAVDSHVLYTSTHHYPHGTVTELKRRAAEQGWKVYQWCYRESMRRTVVVDGRPVQVGWLSEKEVENKRRTIPAAMWKVEFDLQEPSIEGRAISGPAVELAFGQTRFGVYEGGLDEVIETDCCASGRQRRNEATEELRASPEYRALPEEQRETWVRLMLLEVWRPCRNHEYATGIDWGKMTDWTVIATYRTDVTPWWLVAWERTQHQAWDWIVDRANRRVNRYPGKAAHDVLGVGNVNADLLTVDAAPAALNGRARAGAFNAYILGIERGRLLHPRIKTLWYDHLYVTTKDLFVTGGHPPDSFIAGAIAWWTRDGWTDDLDLDLAGGPTAVEDGGGVFFGELLL